MSLPSNIRSVGSCHLASKGLPIIMLCYYITALSSFTLQCQINRGEGVCVNCSKTFLNFVAKRYYQFYLFIEDIDL